MKFLIFNFRDKLGISFFLISGTLSTADLYLQWEPINSLEINEFLIPDYTMTNYSTRSGISCYSDTFPSPRFRPRRQHGVSPKGGRRASPRTVYPGDNRADEEMCAENGGTSKEILLSRVLGKNKLLIEAA